MQQRLCEEALDNVFQLMSPSNGAFLWLGIAIVRALLCIAASINNSSRS